MGIGSLLALARRALASGDSQTTELHTSFNLSVIPYTFADVFGTWYRNTELGGDPIFWQTNRRKAFGVGISGGMRFAQAESCVIQNVYMQDSQIQIGKGDQQTSVFNVACGNTWQGVNAGFVKRVYNSSEPTEADKLYLVECNFEDGVIDETLIDEIGSSRGQCTLLQDAGYRCTGNHFIIREGSSTGKVYDVRSGSVVLSFTSSYTDGNSTSSVCLPNGTSYYLIGVQYADKATISAKIVSVIDGVVSLHTISVAGLSGSDAMTVLRLNYDRNTNRLLLHTICGQSGYYSSTTKNLRTRIYVLNPVTCAIEEELTVPEYILINTNITGEYWHGTTTKLWLNATTAPRGISIVSGVNSTFDSSLDADGYYYTNSLAIFNQESTFYFDEEEKAAPPPAMVGSGGYTSSQGGWSCRFCIANLYFQEDARNFVNKSEID